MELARPRWGLGQGSGQGERELTGQRHGHTTSSCAHPPGNQRQERPQDAEVIDEEEEIAGRL